MADKEKAESVLEGYLTPQQLAEELSTTTRTLIRWHNLRIGPPRVQVGRTILYKRSSVESWLESRQQNPSIRSLKLVQTSHSRGRHHPRKAAA